MKKTFTYLLGVAALLSGAVGANAQSITVDNINYNVTNVRSRTVSLAPNYRSPYKGDFVIPAQVTDTTTNITYTVTAISDYCFASSGPQITSITMPNTIKSVGAQVAPGCSALRKVVFSDQLETMGSGAFAACAVLDSVYLPNSLKTLGSQAFSSCSNLKVVSLGTGIEEIPMMCFYGSAITAVNLPDNIKTVGNSAFGYCRNLKSVHFGKGVQTLGDNLFGSCDSLATLTVDADNAYLTAQDNVLYNKAQDTLYFRLAATPGTSFEVPSTVKVLRQWAFAANKLTSITLPSGLTTISRAAFERCPITSINLPESLDSLGLQAFNYCSQLKEVVVPKNIKYLADQTFYGCTSLEQVTLPASLKNVGSYAFNRDTALKQITVNAVTPPTVGSSAFDQVEVANVKLAVPEGSESLYKAADVWKDFNIVATPTAINQVRVAAAKADGKMFNLAGQQVNSNYKGVVIVNGKKLLNK